MIQANLNPFVYTLIVRVFRSLLWTRVVIVIVTGGTGIRWHYILGSLGCSVAAWPGQR